MLQLFKDKMRKIVAQKHLGKAMIGALAVLTVKKHFGFATTSPIMDGYVQFDKLFIKTNEQHIKIEIFKQKKEILEKVNKAIHNVGYSTSIKEIYIKPKNIDEDGEYL